MVNIDSVEELKGAVKAFKAQLAEDGHVVTTEWALHVMLDNPEAFDLSKVIESQPKDDDWFTEKFVAEKYLLMSALLG